MSKRINVRLPKELFGRLRRSSTVTGLSMSFIVRNSVEKGLSQELENPQLKYDVSSRKAPLAPMTLPAGAIGKPFRC